jgi:hypothetical protein
MKWSSLPIVISRLSQKCFMKLTLRLQNIFFLSFLSSALLNLPKSDYENRIFSTDFQSQTVSSILSKVSVSNNTITVGQMTNGQMTISPKLLASLVYLQ